MTMKNQVENAREVEPKDRGGEAGDCAELADERVVLLMADLGALLRVHVRRAEPGGMCVAATARLTEGNGTPATAGVKPGFMPSADRPD